MNTEFRILLRTGKLHELDAADLALTEAGVPHNLQEESVTGMVTAMPINPSPGPGTWWAILVPSDRVGEAQEVVGQLPFLFTTDPDVWDCIPSRPNRRVVVIGIWVAIVAFLILILVQLFGSTP